MQVADHANIELTTLDELLDEHGRLELSVQIVEAAEQLLEVVHDRLARDADRRVFLRGFHDHRELHLARPLHGATVHGRKLRRRDAVEAEHLLRQALVSGQEQSRRAGTGVTQPQEIQQRRDARVQRADSGERLDEVENEVRLRRAERVRDRDDVLVSTHPCHFVRQRLDCPGELAEHRILRWLERVSGMQERDAHQSSAPTRGRRARPSTCVSRYSITTAVANAVSSMSVAASSPPARSWSDSARRSRASMSERTTEGCSLVQKATRDTISRR